MDEKTMWEDLGKAIKIDDSETIFIGNVDEVDIIEPYPSTGTNYNRLKNKPQINGITLEGNKTAEDLGIDIADSNFVYNQTEASDEWIIVHNLNKYPAVSIIDSAGEEVEGNVHYDSINQVTITFVGAFKGTATLN